MKVIPEVIVYNCGIGCKYYSARTTDSSMFCLILCNIFKKEEFINGFPLECPLEDKED